MDLKQSSPTKRKSKRPEQLVGGVLLLLIAATFGGVGFLFWDIIIEQLQNPLVLTLALLVLAAFLFLFLDRSMRIVAQTYMRQMIKTITSWFVTIDPIEVLENYIVELKENTAKMNRQMHRLRSQMHILEEEILGNRREIKELMKKTQAARDQEEDADFSLYVRKSGRLEDSTQKLSKLLNRMKNVYEGLANMKKHSRNLSLDLADELEIKRKERNAIHTSHSAMEAAMELIDDKEGTNTDFNEALEDIADDVSRKVGEMEHYMKLSDEFLKNVDLKKGVLEDTGMKKLEEWQKQLKTSAPLELKKPMGSKMETKPDPLISNEDGSSKE